MTDYDIDSDDDLSFGDDDGELPSDVDFGSDASAGDDDDEEDEDEDEDEDDDDESDEDESDSSDDEPNLPRKRTGRTKESEAAYELAPRGRFTGTDGKTKPVPKPSFGTGANSIGMSKRGPNSNTDSDSDSDADEAEVGRLPIKLPGGQIQQVEGTTRIALPATKKKVKREATPEEEEEEEGASEDEDSDDGRQMARAAMQKGKFGRMGVAEIVTKEGWKNAQKLQAAKEQIAQLGAEILAGGELIDNVSVPISIVIWLVGTSEDPSGISERVCRREY